jgi:hypothetical protein
VRKRLIAVLTLLGLLVGVTLIAGTSQARMTGRFTYDAEPGRPQLSGAADASLVTKAVGVRAPARARTSNATVVSDDIQVNGDNKADPTQQFGSGEGLPANETSIAINPTDHKNVIGGANDYESAVDSVMGIYSSFDGGKTWPYSRHTRQVVTPDRQMYGSGDPVIVFDSEGTAYAVFIAFGRANCQSYIGAIRSLDKGVTWTVPIDAESEGTEWQVGDGIVVKNGGPDDCAIFHDKEWSAAGPRPEGVPLVEGSDPAHISPDRLYVTWTRFDFGPGGTSFVESPIYEAHSDDQGRHWSEAQEISGASEEFCQVQFGDQDAPACDEDQFSVPVVDPTTGAVYVVYENFNTDSTEFNRYLLVRSFDGGETWEGPFFVSELADGADKYPVCAGSQTLDFMCARTNAAGNIDVNPNNGQLWVTFADNRNGTSTDTNTDVFVVRSNDGGQTWTDQQQVTTSRDDQWFPWLSVAPNGGVWITYFDRQYTPPKMIDTSLSGLAGAGWVHRRVSEVSWNPDLAFRLGSFIGDYNALDTTNRKAYPFWTDARFAEPNVPGNNPPHQQSDVMVDVERLTGR